MKSILIIGKNSKIASEFAKSNFYNFIFTSHKKQSDCIHLTLEHNLSEIFTNDFLRSKKIDYVFIFASISSFESCQKNYQKSSLINIEFNKKIINFFIKRKIKVVFFSTSYVFSSIKNSLRNENSYRKSKFNYSNQKIIVEKYIKRIDPQFKYSIILRLSKVLQKQDKLLLSLLKKPKEITLYDNLFMAPISVNYLNNVLHLILKKNVTGIYHLSGERRISYYELYKIISTRFFSDSINVKADYPKLESHQVVSYDNCFLNMLKTKNKLSINPQKISDVIDDLL